MIKLVFCCRRRPDMTREEFHERWRERHAPLVRSVREALPGMLRYVQSHTLADEYNAPIRASRGSGEPFDGITEVWFESLATMASSTEAGLEAGRRLLADEAEMLDLPACVVFLTEEHEIF